MQLVYIDEYSSSSKRILTGVPQGSLLGLFLLNISVNDIVNINPDATFTNYAKDTSLVFSAEKGRCAICHGKSGVTCIVNL